MGKVVPIVEVGRGIDASWCDISVNKSRGVSGVVEDAAAQCQGACG
jgi:hypothetical protein